MDKISIIVPVYNTAKYLYKSLESICRQTYKNLEILLIDDGSKDGSLEICKEWQEKDSRITIYSQENAGASAARNKGIDLAQGKYVMFVDADDWIESNMIQVLYDEAEKHQVDVACCILQEERDGTLHKEQVKETDFSKVTYVYNNRADSGLALLTVWGPVCKLYRRDLIEDCRFENYEVAEDLLFNSRIICREHFKRALLVNHPFYHYIIYPGSAMKQAFQKKYITAMHVEKLCYEMLFRISPRFGDINLLGCSVSRVFEKYAQLSKEDRKKYKKEFQYCKKFAKEHRKQLLNTSNMHRKISGALKVFCPNLYLQVLIWRYQK